MKKKIILLLIILCLCKIYSNDKTDEKIIKEQKLKENVKIKFKYEVPGYIKGEYIKNDIELFTTNDILNALSPIKEARKRYSNLIGYRIGAYIFMNILLTCTGQFTIFLILYAVGLCPVARYPSLLSILLLPLLIGGVGFVAPMIVFFSLSGLKHRDARINYYNNEIDKLQNKDIVSINLDMLTIKI